MKKIELTNGMAAMVDDEDFEELSKFRWSVSGDGKRYAYYARRYVGERSGKLAYIAMHTEIMNPPSRMVVDHANGDGLDNRRGNLRVCSHGENMFNKRKYRSQQSSKCVQFLPRSGKWTSRIQCSGVRKYIGFFKTEEEASAAYAKAAAKLFGGFAQCNQ